MRVLYVEDEKYLADAVIHLLKKAGITVDWASDGSEGLDLATKGSYDCIVLDIMLPKLSGLEVLRTLRQRKDLTPIIMLSALSEVDDKVRGLESGADDYLAKPFKTAELIARINALTRRPPLQASQTLAFGDLEYNPSERTLNGLSLTAKEADILELLIRTPEQVQPKERILAHVWGSEAVDSYVEVYISYLRKKLQQLGSAVQIKTVRSLGYKITSDNS